MKHPAKKYAREIPVTEQNKELIETSATKYHISEGVRIAADQQGWLPIDHPDGSRRMIPVFQMDGPKGELLNVPEISMVVLHYDIAYLNFRHLERIRPTLIEKLDKSTINEAVSKDLYEFYGHCISCTLSLFAAMEALVSTCVQSTTVYDKRNTRWTTTATDGSTIYMEKPPRLFGAEILQEKMMDKLKRVLPALSGLDFVKAHPDDWRTITRLKKLRDDITHPKPQNDQLLYNQMFQRMFVFEFEEAMEAVKLYLNFYAKETSFKIEDCPCEHNW